MSFSWGPLTEDGAAAESPPPGAVTHESTVEVVGYERRDIGPAADGGWSVFSTLLTERFAGGIEGTGYADHLRVEDPDGAQIAIGVERVVGSVAGRTGSFVLTSHARDQGSGVHGTWTVVPGSATGELAGLCGRGEFTARRRPDGKWYAQDTFTHWFEPPLKSQDDDS
jgi:hypothetical protein